MKTYISKAILAIALVAGLVGCSSHPQATDYDNSTSSGQYSAEQFQKTVFFFGNTVSNNGRYVLAASDETGVFNVYQVDLETGERTALIESKQTTYPVSWFPKDNRFLFAKDNNGDEVFRLFVQDENGEIRGLTPGEQGISFFVGFTKEANSFYIGNNSRDFAAMDLYRFDANTYQHERVFENRGNYNIEHVSSDGRYVLLIKYHSNKDSDLYLLDLTSQAAEPKVITPQKGDISHVAFGFNPEGNKVIYSSNGVSEFRQAMSYDILSGNTELMIKEDWDVNFVYYSHHGRYLVSGINADASTEVTIVDRLTNRPLELPALPPGSVRDVNFSQDEKTMVFYLNSDTSPNNLYVWKVGSPEVKQLTNNINPDIDEKHLVNSQVVRYRSYDGLEIPNLLYKPKNADTEKVPVVLLIHGGPGGQSVSGYHAVIQHLVNHGYAILAVNHRGSSGYGKTFLHLDDKQHGVVDLLDLVYAKKYLQTQDWVDGDRIGIMGESYGGYLAVAALTFHPEEFKAGINIYGVTNWLRTLRNIPVAWESLRKGTYAEMGDPELEEERLRRISPVFHADNITKPMLVIQGANDPRVIQAESDDIVAALEGNGVPVEYLLFPDEGHGFSKKANRITAQEAYLWFLNKYL